MTKTNSNIAKIEKKIMLISDPEYKQWLSDLKLRIRTTQMKSAMRVNYEMLELYWSIGSDIVQRKAESKWGDNFYRTFSRDLLSEFPGQSGFSIRNLQYMKQMYDTFSDVSQITPQLVAQIQNNRLVIPGYNQMDETTPQVVAQFVEESVCSIPWGHIRYILDKKLPLEKALFYVRKTIQHNWSRAMLLNMMGDKNGNGGLYESQGHSINNFSKVLPPSDSEMVCDMMKDPYNFEFLHLHENYKEHDLQQALEENVIKLLIELGNGFAFVGRQVVLNAGGDEYKCDMLFYHLRLHRYIVAELKTVKFQPEFVSKLNFYCTCVNHLMKTDRDEDTIGLLICKEKNNIVAQWTIESNQTTPIGISTYELSNILPAKEELEDKLSRKTGY